MDDTVRRPHQSFEQYSQQGSKPEYRSRRPRDEHCDRGHANPQQQELSEKEDKEYAYIVPRSGSYFEHDDRDVWQPRRGGCQVDRSFGSDRPPRNGGHWRGRGGPRYGDQGFSSRRPPNRGFGERGFIEAGGGQYSPTRHAEAPGDDRNDGAAPHYGRHRDRSPRNFRSKPPADRGAAGEMGYKSKPPADRGAAGEMGYKRPAGPSNDSFHEQKFHELQRQFGRGRRPASPQGKWKHDLFQELEKPADDAQQDAEDSNPQSNQAVPMTDAL